MAAMVATTAPFDVFDVIESAERTTTIDELIALVRPAFSRLGVRYFAYGQATDTHGARAPSVQFGVRHERWAAHYQEENLLGKDAMYPRTLQSSDPFTWGDLRRAGVIDRHGDEVLARAREFDLADGFIVPVHQLNGTAAAVLLSGDAPFDWSVRERASAHLLAIYFTSVGKRLLAAPRAQKRPLLSPRQRECLQWVRANKTDWEIAQILNLSEHTVIEYLEEARKRLGVRTRAQAVIEAISRGLISV
jgi:DNA-binding CsgD family transcriptional regulator